MHDYFLSIAIPTYNRSSKLERLLEILFKQIIESSLNEIVELVVTDNSTNKNSFSVCEKYLVHNNFKYNKNNSNVGFDNNVLLNYNLCSGNYIWFFADDDIPASDSIKTLIELLKNDSPDILLLSFRQPFQSKNTSFNLTEKIYKTGNINESIDLVNHFPKISTYVLKNIDIQNNSELIKPFKNLGWMHLILSYSVLYLSKKPLLLVYSEVLASCDVDFDKLDWGPEVILNKYKIENHPLINKFHPYRLENEKRKAYLNSIQFAFAAKTGKLRVKNIMVYDSFISNLPFNYKYLSKNMKSFIQFLLLKMKLTFVYNFYDLFKITK